MQDFMLSFPREILQRGENTTATFIEMYRRIQTGGLDELLISDKSIAHTLFGDDETKAKASFDVISALGYAKRVDGDSVIVKKEDMYYPSFVLIGLKEYYSLLKAGKTIDKSVALLHHYCCILCSFSWNIEIQGETKIVGNVPYSYFEKREKKSAKTIKRYNDELVELGYISIFPGVFDPKEQKRSCNYYCRKENEAAVKRFIDGSSARTESESANMKRSVTAKFNKYKKNPEAFDQDKAFSVLIGCIKWWDLKKDKDKRKELNIFVKNGVIDEDKLQRGIEKNIKAH